MAVVRDALGSSRFNAQEQLVRASTKGDPLYEAVEILLKGPESQAWSITASPPTWTRMGTGGSARGCGGGTPEHRLSGELAELGHVKTEDGEPYPSHASHRTGPSGAIVRLRRPDAGVLWAPLAAGVTPSTYWIGPAAPRVWTSARCGAAR